MIKVPDGVYAVNYFDNYYTSQKPLNSVRRTTLSLIVSASQTN